MGFARQETNPIPKYKQANVKSGKIAQKTDTLLVTTTSAVRIDLDTTQLVQLRKKYGNDALNTGAEDDLFYAYGTDSVLKANHLPVILVPGDKYKYLKFI